MNTKKEDNVLVAIDKDKGSQYALKWAVDNLLAKNQTVTLLHIKQKHAISGAGPAPDDETAKPGIRQLDNAKELFLPFRCFCTRKEIHCNEILVEDNDVSKGILSYVSANAVEILVLGAPSRSGLVRFRATDMPANIQRAAPEFCTVYIIAKNKVSSVKAASGPPPPAPKAAAALPQQSKPVSYEIMDSPMRTPSNAPRGRSMFAPPGSSMGGEADFRSPLKRNRGPNGRQYEPSVMESDISFVSSGRPSTDRMFPAFSDAGDLDYNSQYSAEFELRSIGSSFSGNTSGDVSPYLSATQDSSRVSFSSQNLDDVEAEMRRLRLELKNTMDMFSSACKEALTAKQKATELHRWKLAEQQKLEEAKLAEEAALALVEKEKAKSKAAIEAAEAARRIAELEAQKRIAFERRAIRETEENQKPIVGSLAQRDIRYRKYTIEEIETATNDFSDSLKIGEGGYGPVYKCYLDHTPVAVKVLRPDAAQGRAQFQQEVEVLSCIRHPNLVLLLGACPEYGCLVYEYMANGSLEDRLFRRGNSPVLSWQARFRITAEIATGLLFLHQTKPEPLVHRDLKPGNILLDRNLVSKISDVGLARLVPSTVANNVTQYRMTATAGTFCYIDPEYQQTGMLGIKSDIYSLGIMLLQIITAKQPMGLTHHVERALERGALQEVLDPAVEDWPMEETTKYAMIALQCAELRRKDRPDLGNVILPELNKMRMLAEGETPDFMFGIPPPTYSNAATATQVSIAAFQK